MSVNVNEEVLIHEGTPTQSIHGIQERSNPQARPTDRHRKKWPFRGFGSKNIFIILAWVFVANCSRHFKDSFRRSPWLLELNSVVYFAAFALSCPVASLLAEVAVGRYKLISYTLRVLWVFSVAGSLLSVCAYFLSASDTTLSMLEYYLVAVPECALQGAFAAVVVPLGLDQIAGGSNRNISAFIIWYLWSIFCAYTTADSLVSILLDCRNFQPIKAIMIMSLLPALLLSVGLILDIYFHHKLVKEPVTANPVSHIFKVLKYAAKHKYPVQRSAFTYCENERPTRLDYGKSKYGGPFTTEQVEDVKTFWRILLVILVIAMLYSPLQSVYASYPFLKSQFQSNSLSSCYNIPLNGAFTVFAFITYSVPLYELLIYPCLRHRGPTILQSAGVGAVATIFSPLYGIMTEVTRQATTNGTIDCMFAQSPPNKSSVPFYFISLLNLTLGFATIVVYKAKIELVCAQAPYNMNSLLISISFTLQTIFRVFGMVFIDSWRYRWFGIPLTSTCGIWFYVTAFVTALAVSFLLLFIIRWYKRRERHDMIISQLMVEEIYYKYIK